MNKKLHSRTRNQGGKGPIHPFTFEELYEGWPVGQREIEKSDHKVQAKHWQELIVCNKHFGQEV